MNITMRTLLALLVGLAVVASSCGSDGDDTVEAGDDSETPTAEPPLGAGPYPIAELTIEYTDGTDASTYTIACLGDTAAVIGDIDGVIDRRACLALAEPDVQERLIEGVPADRLCSAQYGGPDEAVITGRIDDQPVDTQVNLRDGCGISEWQSLLADILPPAGGIL